MIRWIANLGFWGLNFSALGFPKVQPAFRIVSHLFRVTGHDGLRGSHSALSFNQAIQQSFIHRNLRPHTSYSPKRPSHFPHLLLFNCPSDLGVIHQFPSSCSDLVRPSLSNTPLIRCWCPSSASESVQVSWDVLGTTATTDPRTQGNEEWVPLAK